MTLEQDEGGAEGAGVALPSGRAKAVMHDAAKRRGTELPAAYRSAPPIVTWECGVCKRRILRLYLSPRGWYLHGEDYRIPLVEWLDRTVGDGERALVDYQKGELVPTRARKVRGFQETFPLNFDRWPVEARFRGGCRGCGERILSLTELEADARHARKTLKPQVVEK